MNKSPQSSPGKAVVRVVCLGALLAVGYGVIRRPSGPQVDPSRVVVTEAIVAHEQARWALQRGRPPSEQELRAAVDAYVRSEILYREAIAQGLDQNDPRVRLALIQKMDMLAAGRADAQATRAEDLDAYFALRKERYRVPARLSLTQIYFSDEDGNGEARAEALLQEFANEEPSPATLDQAGDRTLLGREHPDLTAPDLEKQFGADFTAAVLAVPEATWSGPVRSAYGFHLVRIAERIPGRIPDLAEVRSDVENDLRYEARQSAEAESFKEIAGKYRVVATDGAEQLLQSESP